MNDISEKWAILWSPHQKRFHQQKFDEMIDANIKIFKNRSQGDYILLDITDSQDQARTKIEELKKIRDRIYPE